MKSQKENLMFHSKFIVIPLLALWAGILEGSEGKLSQIWLLVPEPIYAFLEIAFVTILFVKH